MARKTVAREREGSQSSKRPPEVSSQPSGVPPSRLAGAPATRKSGWLRKNEETHPLEKGVGHHARKRRCLTLLFPPEQAKRLAFSAFRRQETNPRALKGGRWGVPSRNLDRERLTCFHARGDGESLSVRVQVRVTSSITVVPTIGRSLISMLCSIPNGESASAKSNHCV